MTKQQREHLNTIIKTFEKEYSKKYKQGAKEHGGNLWQKGGIIDMAIEEAYDLVGYLLTLKYQMENGIAIDKLPEEKKKVH